MNQTLIGLVQGMQRALRDDVLPELATEHARCQLFGVLEVLGKLGHLAVWSPDLLRQQAQAMADGIAALEVHGAPSAAHDVQPPAEKDGAADAPGVHARLEREVQAGERRLQELIDWIFDPANGLDDNARAEADKLLRETLRKTLVIERNVLPRVDFSAMSGGAGGQN